MASSIVSGIQKAEEAVRNTASHDKKDADMSRDTAEVRKDTKMTTDFGCPVSNTDNWLRAVDPQRTGPSLLEDQIAREKVK
jgi:catalase